MAITPGGCYRQHHQLYHVRRSDSFGKAIAMTVLSDLKPTKKFLVMNLLADAGFDVSDWANYDGEHPASNPKYCYNWSFEQPGEMFAVCLWFSGLKKRGDEIYHTLVPRSRGARRKDPGSANWNKRADEMQDRVRRAYEQQLPIRVIVVDGKQRNPNDVKPVASKVSARLLDPEPWAALPLAAALGGMWPGRGRGEGLQSTLMSAAGKRSHRPARHILGFGPTAEVRRHFAVVHNT